MSYDLGIPLLGISLRKGKHMPTRRLPHRYPQSPYFFFLSRLINTRQKILEDPKYSSNDEWRDKAACTRSGILFSNKEKLPADTSSTTGLRNLALSERG